MIATSIDPSVPFLNPILADNPDAISPKGEGEKYLDNNVKSIDRDATVVHHDLHGKLGFTAFRHTNVKDHPNRSLEESMILMKLDELGEYDNPVWDALLKQALEKLKPDIEEIELGALNAFNAQIIRYVLLVAQIRGVYDDFDVD